MTLSPPAGPERLGRHTADRFVVDSGGKHECQKADHMLQERVTNTQGPPWLLSRRGDAYLLRNGQTKTFA